MFKEEFVELLRKDSLIVTILQEKIDICKSLSRNVDLNFVHSEDDVEVVRTALSIYADYLSERQNEE